MPDAPFPLKTSIKTSIAALLALVAIGAVACGRSEPAGSSPRRDAPPVEDPIVDVETDRVRRGSILQRIAAPGSIVARRESRIGAEVRGRIERIHVSEGDRLEAGDPLFEIERAPYELTLRQAEARLDQSRAEREKIEADLARAGKLRRKAVVAEQKMDALESGLEIAKAAERVAVETVALAQRNLDKTLVRAPYASSVAARLQDEGTTAQAQPQTIVLVLQETTYLEAQATIPEIHFASIRTGDAALLHIQGLAQPIATEIFAVTDSIDAATRTYLVKMKVPNLDHRLKAGVFARVEILPQAKRDVLLVPRQAIRREDGRTQVLLVREGRAVATPIRIGIVSEDFVEVLSGVRVDDEIVVGESARRLAPGMRVRPERVGEASPESEPERDRAS